MKMSSSPKHPNGIKDKRKKYPNVKTKDEKTYVFFEAQVSILKIDNVDQCGLKKKKVKTGAKWKLLTLVKYDIEGSYYIEVIDMS